MFHHLKFLKNIFKYFIEYSTILIIWRFLRVKLRLWNLRKNVTEVPSLLYHIGSQIISNWLITSDVIFNHLEKWYLSGFSIFKVIFFSLIDIFGEILGSVFVFHLRLQPSAFPYILQCALRTQVSEKLWICCWFSIFVLSFRVCCFHPSAEIKKIQCLRFK